MKRKGKKVMSIHDKAIALLGARTVHTNCGCSVKPLNLENETCASEAALNMKKIRSKRLKTGKLIQNNEKKLYAS